MKRVLLKIRYIIAVLCATCALTSCNDFLGTVPLNEIVLENFWENEEEVNSVVMSCYSRMAQGDFLTRLILWGELRSDNVVAGNITGSIPYVNNDQLLDMLDGSILPNHYIADWSSFYSVINRCNTVLHYAPEVVDRDPDYNESEWNYQRAEMYTLRALCYFYLVRSFRDVPFVTEPTIDDSRDFKVPAADPDSVLNQLVLELQEYAEPYALKEFPEGNSAMYSYSKARVTKLTVWALLADMCLWLERYDDCIAYCEKIIEAKVAEAEELNMNYDGDYPLIANQKGSQSNSLHQAYRQIFGIGFSFESIFEMPFGYNYEDKRDAMRSYYGSIDVPIGAMSASTFLAEGIAEGNNKIFKADDIRAIESFNTKASGTFPIHKYVLSSVSDDNKTFGYPGFEYPNWIFYRLTDVMLMEAEALVERNDSVGKDAVDLVKAFDLVSAVYTRANLKGDALKKKDYSTQVAMRDLVLLERQRELLFEGKRWFDLVRKARREGNNSAMLDLATQKYTNPGSVKSKWIKPDMLYLPIHEDELKVNTMLVQNPEYETEKTITTAK